MNPIIFLDPSSGPVGTAVNITGAGFDPGSTITIKFDGNNIATTPSTVTSTAAGFFTAAFNVPSSSSNGDHTVVGTDGTNAPSKTFAVTSGPINSTTTTASSPHLSEKIILPDIFA